MDEFARSIVRPRVILTGRRNRQAFASGRCGRRGVLALSGRDHGQAIRRPGLLQLQRGCRVGFEPDVAGIASKDHRHGFAVHQGDHIIRLCGQECEEQVLASLALTGAGPGPPDAGDRKSPSASRAADDGGDNPLPPNQPDDQQQSPDYRGEDAGAGRAERYRKDRGLHRKPVNGVGLFDSHR